MPRSTEVWSSQLGVILAVAGSAVGLGNFLRFPGLAAEYGGGAFMIAYFVSLLIIGIPICWTEWTLGRLGGRYGYHSTIGIFHALVRNKWGKYLGVLGFVVPVMIYMYYIYIEAWSLGYALNSLTGNLGPGTDFGAFFGKFTGAAADGAAIQFGLKDVGIYLLIVYILNFYLVYRGISKGIEMVCKFALPALIVIALIMLVRVLTLGTPDAAKPEQSLANGLGFMWNPAKPVVERLVEGRWTAVETIASPNLLPAVQARIAMDGSERITETSVIANLKNPILWLAAAGQIFFTLSVGFGVIITYASYMRRNDDVVLSSLTAAATNEFCEVALGGMITVPAAFVFLGAAGIVGQGTFGLGFNVLPEVFALMPFGQGFATLFFILLFLAALTSSISMLQPGIAFLEEGLGIKRKASVALLGLITGIGTMFVWFFSKDLKALDTIDFWVGTLMLFVQGTILIIIFGWVVGMEKGWKEAHHGAQIRIPRFFKPVIKYVTPGFLLTIFVGFILQNVFGWNFQFGAEATFNPTGYVQDLVGENASPVARLTVGFIIIMTLFTCLLVSIAGRVWEKDPLVEAKD